LIIWQGLTIWANLYMAFSNSMDCLIGLDAYAEHNVVQPIKWSGEEGYTAL